MPIIICVPPLNVGFVPTAVDVAYVMRRRAFSMCIEHETILQLLLAGF